jgi:phosphatidylglycerophosphatase C
VIEGMAAVGETGKLVFFDLDGTITHRDTLVPFVAGYLIRNPARIMGLTRALPALLRFLLGRADRGALKGALINATLAGCSRQQIETWSAEFVPRLLRRGVFTDAIAAIRAHQAQGDHLVLMSASVDLYVPRIGIALGFSETVCSRVIWQGDSLDGHLDGPNCRDVVKAHWLERVRARFPERSVVAYGNSSPDLPHLRLADQALLVNPGRSLRREAGGRAIQFVHWS